jgi:hypothetical protein
MKDISELIQFWIRCCCDLWTKWFKNREHGAHEFVEIEDKLLEILVIAQALHGQQVISPEEFIRRIKVRYTKDVTASRQVCKRQAAGNVFGKAEDVVISKGSLFSVRGIDTMGTMLNSGPYVEVVWKDGFILEPINNLEFLLGEAL